MGRQLAAVATLAVLASCGGSSSSPSSVPSSTPIATTPASGFAFTIDPAVSTADQTAIRDGLDLAQAFFLATFGHNISGTVSVTESSAAGSVPASAGSASMTFNTGNSVWTTTSSVNKRKITVHEMFHIFQFQYLLISNPRWYVEGSAEYVGYQGVAFANLLDFNTAKGCQLFSAAHSSDPIPTLRDGGIPANGAYWMAFMAIDFMAAGNLKTFANMVNRPTTIWDAKMQDVNGMTADQFYDAFESARQGFVAPTQYLCPQ
jgi:hypothetical protein